MSQIWDTPRVKLAVFHPAARDAIRSFPKDVRRELGKAIFDLQKGLALSMPLSRRMPSVAGGFEELRIRDRSGSCRVLYYAGLPRSVLLFHAFVKKSRVTPQRVLELGRKRFKELLDEIQVDRHPHCR